MFIKPHTTIHNPASKTGTLMGASSARLTVAKQGVPIETSEEGFAAVRGLVAYATKLKLPVYPGSPCFVGDEHEFVSRTPAEVLAMVTTAEAAGLECWLSKRGNVSIGVRPVEGAKPKAAPRPVNKGEDAALAAFMKVVG